MKKLIKPEEHARPVTSIPHVLPILPLRNTVAYPFSILPLAVGIPRSVKLVEDALQGDNIVGLVAIKDASIEEPLPEQIHEIGTAARIFSVVRTPDNTMQVIIQGLERFRIERWLGTEPYMRAQIALIPDAVDPNLELDALQRSLRDLAKEVISLSPNLPDEVGQFLDQVHDPRYLTYLVAANAHLDIEKGQEILEMDHVKDKLRALISHLSHEKEVLSLGQKIQTEAREEIDKAQREFYLRQQLKAIQKALGEGSEGKQTAFAEYTEKLESAELPEEAKKETQRELKRLEGMSPQSPEYSVIKTYLDWLLELPWNVKSKDQLDITHARIILDEDHYDLQEVKDRIIEYLGVRKLVKERGVETDPGEEVAVSECPSINGLIFGFEVCKTTSTITLSLKTRSLK